MKTIDTTVLFTPESEALRYLPEGPYRCPDGHILWVAIQHGASAKTGSLNRLDPSSGNNLHYELAGRPGFAFPTADPNEFVIGMERSIVRFNVEDNRCQTLVDGVDHQVEGTIINDGLVYDGHLIFGCKDLAFTDKKAGLYLLPAGTKDLIQLRDDQICSNGKAVSERADGGHVLYDICSCSKQVLAWDLDFEGACIANPRVIVDLTQEAVFPDGMIMTPDEASLIVALYDPRTSAHGEARQYDIHTGSVQTVWRCPGSPRVTCPQLIQHDGGVRLLLTTADEGMTPEARAQSTNAGCLFVGETEFSSLNDAPPYLI